ncbi:hypothetical protein ACFPRL_16330 [Pseudoclavibacter helvolus]
MIRRRAGVLNPQPSTLWGQATGHTGHRPSVHKPRPLAPRSLVLGPWSLVLGP